MVQAVDSTPVIKSSQEALQNDPSWYQGQMLCVSCSQFTLMALSAPADASAGPHDLTFCTPLFWDVTMTQPLHSPHKKMNFARLGIQDGRACVRACMCGCFSPSLWPVWDLLLGDMPPSAWLLIAPAPAGTPGEWYGRRRRRPPTRRGAFRFKHGLMTTHRQ